MTFLRGRTILGMEGGIGVPAACKHSRYMILTSGCDRRGQEEECGGGVRATSL